mmetsp:Transcript_127467/g.224535  ORF Transcript_127467/g.224535 Transcript_127467/m.224535 type:complete len:84 (-) Transcript_127467:2251-2502(-)
MRGARLAGVLSAAQHGLVSPMRWQQRLQLVEVSMELLLCSVWWSWSADPPSSLPGYCWLRRSYAKHFAELPGQLLRMANKSVG